MLLLSTISIHYLVQVQEIRVNINMIYQDDQNYTHVHVLILQQSNHGKMNPTNPKTETLTVLVENILYNDGECSAKMRKDLYMI